MLRSQWSVLTSIYKVLYLRCLHRGYPAVNLGYQKHRQVARNVAGL